MDVPTLSTFLNPMLTAALVCNTGETGDINHLNIEQMGVQYSDELGIPYSDCDLTSFSLLQPEQTLLTLPANI